MQTHVVHTPRLPN